MDTYIDRILITKFDSSYEVKEYMLKILLDMGMANLETKWSSVKGIHTLCTDQINIALSERAQSGKGGNHMSSQREDWKVASESKGSLAQRNAKPTYIMEFYSKVPLRHEGPTIYLLKGAIESIRSKFMHPELYQDNFVPE